MISRFLNVGILMTALLSFYSSQAQHQAQLQRISYTSTVDQSDRQFLVYLPKGYEADPNKKWPVILFLHGNGERGNGTTELDFVMVHGPLYEAWIQKRDLPFIIIAPQLHMFGMDSIATYIADRSLDQLPRQLKDGVPKREPKWTSAQPMNGDTSTAIYPYKSFGPPMGWEQVTSDLLHMLDRVNKKFRTDTSKTYLTGLSYGGFGTWYLASQNPELFAAIAPVVGWGHKDLIDVYKRQVIRCW